MAKRIYWQTIFKWATGLGITGGTAIGLLFFYLAVTGAITDYTYSGDMVCAGTLEDPCYAYINFTAKEDIFLYPIDYDPWGRNSPFEFDPNVKEWYLQRSWGSGWRTIPLNQSCTGTWCGLSNSADERKFSVAFREGRDYQIRIVALKNNPNENIKWTAFDVIDPYWLPSGGAKPIDKVRPMYTENSKTECNGDICTTNIYGGTRFVKYQGTWYDRDDAPNWNESSLKCSVSKDVISDPDVKCVSWNSTTIQIDVKADGLTPIKILDNNEQLKREYTTVLDKQSFSKRTYSLSVGEKLHVGANSTEVYINDSNTIIDNTLQEGASTTVFDTVTLQLMDRSGDDHRIMLRFEDLSSIPSNATILNATLNLWSFQSKLDFGETVVLKAYHVYQNFSWEETNITWDKQPLVSNDEMNGAPSGFYNASGDDDDVWMPLDIKEFLQSELVNGNISLYINASEGTGSPSSADQIDITNSEDGANQDQIPIINVSYSTDSPLTPCSCPDGQDWIVDLSESCRLDSPCSVVNVNYTNTGTFNISDQFNITGQEQEDLSSGQLIYIHSDALVRVG